MLRNLKCISPIMMFFIVIILGFWFDTPDKKVYTEDNDQASKYI